MPSSQNTFRICMRCNECGILTKDLMLLNTTLRGANIYGLVLRCSKGHILLYEGDYKHIDSVFKVFLDKEKEKKEIDELKQEISLLKSEIAFLTKEPTAPELPVLIANLVESEEIK